jgi:hypothetical protein
MTTNQSFYLLVFGALAAVWGMAWIVGAFN